MKFIGFFIIGFCILAGYAAYKIESKKGSISFDAQSRDGSTWACSCKKK